jgi:hypothetical protein
LICLKSGASIIGMNDERLEPYANFVSFIIDPVGDPRLDDLKKLFILSTCRSSEEFSRPDIHFRLPTESYFI